MLFSSHRFITNPLSRLRQDCKNAIFLPEKELCREQPVFQRGPDLRSLRFGFHAWKTGGDVKPVALRRAGHARNFQREPAVRPAFRLHAFRDLPEKTLLPEIERIVDALRVEAERLERQNAFPQRRRRDPCRHTPASEGIFQMDGPQRRKRMIVVHGGVIARHIKRILPADSFGFASPLPGMDGKAVQLRPGEGRKIRLERTGLGRHGRKRRERPADQPEPFLVRILIVFVRFSLLWV